MLIQNQNIFFLTVTYELYLYIRMYVYRGRINFLKSLPNGKNRKEEEKKKRNHRIDENKTEKNEIEKYSYVCQKVE